MFIWILGHENILHVVISVSAALVERSFSDTHLIRNRIKKLNNADN